MSTKNNICYFTANLVLKSPLHIGSGLDENSDNDILLDVDGRPYIPATTLAGKFRHYLEYLGEVNVKKYFGYTTDERGVRSAMITYDAILIDDNNVVSIRDNVRIDSEGIAANEAKFDYEILEPGVTFRFKAEIAVENQQEAQELLSDIFHGINEGNIRLGAKTTRGLGLFSMENPQILKIDLHLRADLQKYIDFDWSDVTEPFKPVSSKSRLYETLTIQFKVNSFLFIRNYATLAKDANNNNKLVDAEQLQYANGQVIIPGTSWAGVFRHHMERILNKTEPDKQLIDELFGNVVTTGKKKEKSRSKIIFSETVVEKSGLRNRTRNAIDRFTGSAGDGLLFTTRPGYLGQGELNIKIPVDLDDETKRRVKSLIDVCIMDFNDGLLNIGGEGATGGGLISMQKAGGWK